MTSVHDFTPHWPTSVHMWAAFAFVLCMGSFKLDRGTLMYRRSTYIDRFGWSIVWFDWIFAVTLIATSIALLYPRIAQIYLRFDIPAFSLLGHRFTYVFIDVFFWVTLIPLFLALLWQWIEVRLSAHERIAISMAGAESNTTWQPGYPDRRNGLPGRRITDGGTS